MAQEIIESTLNEQLAKLKKNDIERLGNICTLMNDEIHSFKANFADLKCFMDLCHDNQHASALDGVVKHLLSSEKLEQMFTFELKRLESNMAYMNAKKFISHDEWVKIIPELTDKREFDSLKNLLIGSVNKNENKIEDFSNLEREMNNKLYSLAERVHMSCSQQDYLDLKAYVSLLAPMTKVIKLED